MALPGLTILAYLQTQDLSNKWKDKIPLVIELGKTYTADSLSLFQNFLQNNTLTKNSVIEFHTRNEALDEMKSDASLGLQDSLIENPFRDIFLLYLDSQVQNSEELSTFKSQVKNFSLAENIEIGNNLKSGLSQTLDKLKMVLASVTVLMALFAFFIINYLVRLNFGRKLDTVKTLKMLGGSPEMAYKPYSKQGIRLGLASSFLSIVFLGLGLLCIFILVPSLYSLLEIKNFIIVILILAILGPTLHLLRLKSLVNSFFKS